MKKILSVSFAVFLLLTAKAQNCPASIRVNAPNEQVTAGDILTFTVQISGSAVNMTYNWSVSAGTILSGQGTATIMVNTEGLAGSYITATADLGGLPRECRSSFSATAKIMQEPEKIISANYTTPQALTAAVKKFIIQTDLANSNISQKAFIYVYKGVATTSAQLKMINTTIVSAFKNNGINTYQYTIAAGGKKKTASFEIYRLMQGTKEPKPSK